MIRSFLFCTFAALLAACTPQVRPAAVAPADAPSSDPVAHAWGFDQSDLLRDTEIRYGLLPNGMRYAIRRNATPLHAASIRLRFDVGSTDEARDQLGLAHFLEHMAFNGSRNVPEGEMVKTLERFGLAFGPDTNASTGFDQTIYSLDLPEASAAIDTGLMLMREVADGLTISPKAVDRERGVILSERRARDQFNLRRLEHFIDFALPDTPVARSLPIGDPDVIRTAPPERIRDLYTRYYTPGRATLVIVGDIDPDLIEAQIRERFSDWSAAETADESAPAEIDKNRPGAAAYFRNPAVPTSVSLFTLAPRDLRADSIAKRQDDLVSGLADAIVSRRLARIARGDDAPIVGGSASSGELLATAEQSVISVSAKGDDWKGALTVADHELRRAMKHGFTQAEFDEQIANIRTGFETAARGASTRRSGALAGAIVATLDDRSIVTTPAYRLALFEEFAPKITLAMVQEAFRARWSAGNWLVHVSGKQALDKPEASILTALAESRATPVEPYQGTNLSSFAYDEFGPAGVVTSDGRIEDLGIRTVRFANNVRLSIKSTDFEKDRIRISLRIGGGSLEFAKDKPGLTMLMNSAFSAGGLEKHSFDDLQSMLAGRSVTLGLSAGEEAFGGTVTTTPRDFDLQMKLFAASLTAPGFRAEGDAQWQRLIPSWYDTLNASPAAIVARDAGRIVASGDPRFGVPGLDTLKARNLAELRAATANAFRTGAIEIGVVGDVTEQQAIDVVARTIGALPVRDAEPAPFDEARTIRFPAPPVAATLLHEGKADQAMTLSYWPTGDDRDALEVARLNILAAVMRIMLTDELRERLGATYSPSAGSAMSGAYPGYGYVSVSATITPENAVMVDAAIAGIAARLRETPVDADLLLRARKPLLERIERNRRENGAWLGIVARAQGAPRYLDRFRQAQANYERVTPEDLRAAALRYLDPAARLVIHAMPRPVQPPLLNPVPAGAIGARNTPSPQEAARP